MVFSHSAPFVWKTWIPFEIYSHLQINFQGRARIKVHLNFNFKHALTTSNEVISGRLLLDFQIMNRQISNPQATLSNGANC